MQEEKLRAIVLKHVPYKDNQAILTVLSDQKGLSTIFLKGLTKKNSSLIAVTNPLCQAEFLCQEGSSGMLRCKEASIINPHYFLREKYDYLHMGLTFIKVILDTQFPGKDSSSLYFLLSSYLKKIPDFEHNMHALKASFLVKILKNEGLIHPKLSCIICDQLDGNYLYNCDFFCQQHKPVGATYLPYFTWEILHILIHSLSFKEIRSLPITVGFTESIQIYFSMMMSLTTGEAP
jgi:DNA repair protein RecO